MPALLVDPVSDLGHRDIVVVRWPDDAAEVERLAATGSPRLLLVGAEADPPAHNPCEQDWIRLPADERDIAARMQSIRERAGQHQVLPHMDEAGRLHHRGEWVPLSAIERRLAEELVERFGTVVSCDDLIRVAWSDAAAHANSLRVQLTRLRHRIRPLGLEVTSVRSAGYVLEELPRGSL